MGLRKTLFWLNFGSSLRFFGDSRYKPVSVIWLIEHWSSKHKMCFGSDHGKDLDFVRFSRKMRWFSLSQALWHLWCSCVLGLRSGLRVPLNSYLRNLVNQSVKVLRATFSEFIGKVFKRFLAFERTESWLPCSLNFYPHPFSRFWLLFPPRKFHGWLAFDRFSFCLQFMASCPLD